MVHPLRLVACLLISSSLTADCLKLLDVAAPRTGTQTLYAAMNILKMKTLHSGYCNTVGCRDTAVQYLFEGGPLQPVLELFEYYDVAMDEPFLVVVPRGHGEVP